MALRSSSSILYATGLINSLCAPPWVPMKFVYEYCIVCLLSEQQDIATTLPCCTTASPQVVFFVVASSPSWLCPQLHCCTRGVHGLRQAICILCLLRTTTTLLDHWACTRSSRSTSSLHLAQPHIWSFVVSYSPPIYFIYPIIVGYIVIFYPHRSMHHNHHRGLRC
jgi:hypothetical protein